MNKKTSTTRDFVTTGVLLNESWDIFSKHFSLFVFIVLPAVILNLISVAAEFLGEDIAIPLYSFFLFSLLMFIAELWTGIAIVVAAVRAKKGIRWNEAFIQGGKLARPYAWILILSTLMTVAGLILLIIPGIIFEIWFTFALFAFVVGGKRGMPALLYSKHLVQGNWWRVFWRFLVLAALIILVILPTVLLGVAEELASDMPEVQRFLDGTVTQRAIIEMIYLPIAWLAGAFVMVFMYVFYEYLVNRKKDVAFAPSTKERRIFTALAFLPVVLIIVVAVFFAALLFLVPEYLKDPI